MINFQESKILDILPENFQSDEVVAFSYALKKAMEKLLKFSRACPVHAAISDLPEQVLDLLAVEMRTQYYDLSMPLEIKQKLIAQTIPWYMRAGTPSVIKEFLETLYDGGEVVEWFQYEGVPYYFKVKVFVNEGEVTNKHTQQIREQIEAYKNKRSWLELLIYVMSFFFLVDIHYAEKMTIGSTFYPRGNILKLYLDGKWHLDGTYRLNGLKIGGSADSHPLTLKVLGSVVTGLGSESSVIQQTWLETPVRTSMETVKVVSHIEQKPKEDSRQSIGSQVRVASFCQVCLNVEKNLWYIDGTHKLDGKKLLHAEIRHYDL